MSRRLVEYTLSPFLSQDGMPRRFNPAVEAPQAESFVGRQLDVYGERVDVDAAEGVQELVNDVTAWVKGKLATVKVKPNLHASAIGVDVRAQPLVVAISYGDDLITPTSVVVWEYHSGHAVRKADSHQSAVLLSAVMGSMSHRENCLSTAIRVVQPFCFKNDGPIQQWKPLATELKSREVELWRMRNQPDETRCVKAGPHCTRCSACWACPATSLKARAAVDYVEMSPEMEFMTGPALATELQFLEEAAAVLKARKEALTDVITQKVEGGDGTIPMAVETYSGRLKWTVEPSEVRALGVMLGVDVETPQTITPTQLLKKSEAFRSIQDQFAKRPTLSRIKHHDDSNVSRTFKKR